MSLNRTHLIAVVVPFITTASVVERPRGVMDAIEGTEYDLVIYNVESVRSRNRYFRRLPRRERDLVVPDQVSVVGYDDIEVARYLGLTTIHQPLFESGREGARLLLDSLEAVANVGAAPARRVLPVSLVLRHTTAPPPPGPT